MDKEVGITPFFELRDWQPGDETSLALHANNIKIWLNMRNRFPHPYTRRDARAWIAHTREAEPALERAIVVNGMAVGGLGMALGVDIGCRTAEIGYWLGEAYWGKGLMTRALTEWLAYAWATFPVNRLEAGVFGWNPASGRVLEKAGFELEGVLKNAVYKDGRFTDRLIYAAFR